MSERTCSVDGCAVRASCKGYCKVHYARWHRWGDPLHVSTGWRERRRKYVVGDVCSVDGCDKPMASRTFCHGHYRSLRLYGDPLAARRRHPDAWSQTPDGYLVKMIDGRMWSKHRYVMTQHIGRELLPHENVHHINGDRADNRPENLELWSTSQPPGQRVADKIAWCVQFLRDEAPQLLAE